MSAQVRFVRSVGGELQPWHTHPSPSAAWALSEVRVRTAKLDPKRNERSEDLQRLAETMPDKARYCVLLKLNERGQARAFDERGRAVQVNYDSQQGLTIQPQEDQP